jgi:hypothetical protein
VSEIIKLSTLAKREEERSLQRDLVKRIDVPVESYSNPNKIKRLVADLDYAVAAEQKDELKACLEKIEEEAAYKREQLSGFYSRNGDVVSLIGNVPEEAKRLRQEITNLLFEEDDVRRKLKYNPEEANYIAKSIVDELAKLPRSRKAEDVYRRLSRPQENQEKLAQCVDAIREAAPDGNWIYFPTEKSKHQGDTYFVQLARVSKEKSVLELAMIYHGNSEDVVFTKVTPDGKADIKFEEFKDGGHAVNYFMEKVISDN